MAKWLRIESCEDCPFVDYKPSMWCCTYFIDEGEFIIGDRIPDWCPLLDAPKEGDKEMYWKYLKYLLEHKKNVGIECLKMGLLLHAITHDLSKFRPSEFIPYARFFMRKDRANNYKQSDENDKDFQRGWNHHQKRNKHHWNYWISVTKETEIIPVPMPKKYIRQMIADWRGMARKFGGTAREYYEGHKQEMILHPITAVRINVYWGEDEE